MARKPWWDVCSLRHQALEQVMWDQILLAMDSRLRRYGLGPKVNPVFHCTR
jgi:hypothetical protein